MTIDGAINFNETTDYIIYTMNSVTTGQYGVVVPKNFVGTINMLVDLHMKNSFDDVSNGRKTKEQLIEEIRGEYDKLKSKYVDGMLVMPMIDEVSFQSAVTNNDKQKMFDEVKKIGAITSELYKKMTDSGIEKQKIDQKIIIVEKDQNDENFVSWLKVQMPNFVDGIRYSELGSNSLAAGISFDNGLFGPAVGAQESSQLSNPVSASSGSIFDNPSSTSFEQVVPTPSVEPAVPIPPVEPFVPTVEAVTNAVPNSNVDIFGIPMDVSGVNNTDTATSSNINNPSVNPTLEQGPIATQVNTGVVSSVDAPKPVESSPLEGTTTFSPISNTAVDASANVADIHATENGDGSVGTEIGSKGFANLAILVVILVGVTIVSIELGKFLYSVYGA